MKAKLLISYASFIFLLNHGMLFGQESTEEIKPHVLDGTEWEINAVSTTEGQGGKTVTDKLIFKDKKFSSENFSKQEYNHTNCTISMRGSNTVFETMQSKEGGNVFWRGEIQDDSSIRGIYSIRTEKGKTDKVEDYSFNGRLVSGTLVREGEEPPKEVIQPVEVTVPVEETPVEEAVPTETEEQNPPKKKRWWE